MLHNHAWPSRIRSRLQEHLLTAHLGVEAMKINGPAPHIINERLAMLGLLWGAWSEIRTGQTIMQQVQAAPVLVGAVAFIISYASLAPIMKGAKSEAFGAFSPRAEVTNGRAACLGFACLLYLENRAGVPFF